MTFSAHPQEATRILRLLGEKTAMQRVKIAYFGPLAEQALERTCRRIFVGETASAEEEIVSLFEPHMPIIPRGKLNQPTEFGRKAWLDEADGGIIRR